VDSLPDQGQRFVVEYRLRNLCHACELVGFARFAFDFDHAGQFLGTRLRGVAVLDQVSTDATQPIQVISGQDFTLAVASNRTTGYQWQLARPLDEAMVRFTRSQYRDVATGRPGAGGEELWTFQAVGQGQAQITMQYVRPWERRAAPVKQMTFVVVVHK
jgi:predicted secreted protein